MNPSIPRVDRFKNKEAWELLIYILFEALDCPLYRYKQQPTPFTYYKPADITYP